MYRSVPNGHPPAHRAHYNTDEEVENLDAIIEEQASKTVSKISWEHKEVSSRAGYRAQMSSSQSFIDFLSTF